MTYTKFRQNSQASKIKSARSLRPGDVIVLKGASRTIESISHRAGITTIHHEIGKIFCPSSSEFLLSMVADDVLDQVNSILGVS